MNKGYLIILNMRKCDFVYSDDELSFQRIDLVKH